MSRYLPSGKQTRQSIASYFVWKGVCSCNITNNQTDFVDKVDFHRLKHTYNKAMCLILKYRLNSVCVCVRRANTVLYRCIAMHNASKHVLILQIKYWCFDIRTYVSLCTNFCIITYQDGKWIHHRCLWLFSFSGWCLRQPCNYHICLEWPSQPPWH